MTPRRLELIAIAMLCTTAVSLALSIAALTLAVAS